MDMTPISGLVDRLAKLVDEVPLDEAGNPIWDLPTCMEDDLGGDNPLGELFREFARTITRSNP